MIIFSRVSAKVFFFGFFLGFFLVFFCVFGAFVFVFRALARNFFGFIFRDEPSKAGNLCPGERTWTADAPSTNFAHFGVRERAKIRF